MLDDLLFDVNNFSAIVADSQDNAKKLFSNNIKRAYEDLLSRSPDIKKYIHESKFNESELSLNKNSVIAGTRLRGGTYKRLHISEFGVTSYESPVRSKELIVSGFPAAERGQIIIESTAKGGSSGDFYNLVCQAQKPNSEWKLIFSPWYIDPQYVTEPFDLTKEQKDYFVKNKLEHLSIQQKCWYWKTATTLGNDMLQEYPSTISECFAVGLEGNVYGEALSIINKNTLDNISYDNSKNTYCCFDLGFGDATSYWVIQQSGNEYIVIDFYENSGVPIKHYIDKIMSSGYHINKFILPHDAGHVSLHTGKNMVSVFHDLGISGNNIILLPRTHDIWMGINAIRDILPRTYFSSSCKVGIDHLKQYKRKYNQSLGIYTQDVCHDNHSHAADAFRYFGEALHNNLLGHFTKKETIRPKQAVMGRRF
jgi:hypothetical protein